MNKLEKNQIGFDCLELKDDNGVNLVSNFDFSEDNFMQDMYEFEYVSENIFPKYKDL